MKLRLSSPALLLALLVTFALPGAPPASAQTRGISVTGSSGGSGGHLDITIETYGTYLGVQAACSTERILISVPIPYPADCHVITQAIFDALSVSLNGIFAVYQDQPRCTVYFYRNVDPECTYFETKVAGEWVGLNFVVVEDPTPVQKLTWGLLKAQEWRAALRGEYVAPRRAQVPALRRR